VPGTVKRGAWHQTKCNANLIYMFQANLLQYTKIIYITSLAFWFYSLMFLYRLFTYHTKAKKTATAENQTIQKHLTKLEKKVWFLTAWPALLATLASGSFLVVKLAIYKEGWLHFKIMLMLGLIIHHLHCGRIRKDLIKDTQHRSVFQLRVLQFITYFLLISIISIPFFKNL
jgi:protoporphyrinogen IX oxidase